MPSNTILSGPRKAVIIERGSTWTNKLPSGVEVCATDHLVGFEGSDPDTHLWVPGFGKTLAEREKNSLDGFVGFHHTNGTL